MGAAVGALGGVLLVIFPPNGSSPPLITTLIGSLFGLWVASMVGAAVPNSQLKQFQRWINHRAMLLLMVDVPFGEEKRITDLVTSRHPEAWAGRQEPTIPAFP